MASRDIKALDDRSHCLKRPQMYVGAITPIKSADFAIEDGKVCHKEIEIVPGLIKIINEIIDNSIDASIRANFKCGTNISVKITDTKVTVQDDGSGIPVKQTSDGSWMPFLAWGHLKAGSNFDDDENRTTIGTFGVGSACTNIFSKKFTGITCDGNKTFKVVFKDNAGSSKWDISEATKQGTTVEFEPDLQRFGITGIDETHKNVIFQRLQCLAIAYPEINFKYNNKSINFKSFKNFASLFGAGAEIYENKNVKIAVVPNNTDDFKQFSYVNGLKVTDGGTHIDAISGEIVSQIREKLQRKYKNIKPGDIKNKLTLVVFVSGFPNAKFNSQTKEKLTNPSKEFNDFAKIDYSFVNKILKNQDIINPIVEIYKIKQEFEDRKALKSVTSKKKLKSEKYFRCTGKPKYLCICEGFSAYGGISPVLNNIDVEYYVLKGKPLNSFEISNQKMVQNRELSELYKILGETEYNAILVTSDMDLDGEHIAALISGFIEKFAPHYKGRFGRLKTPIKAAIKNGKVVRWTYDIQSDFEPKIGEMMRYYKGLGTWSKQELEDIVAKDGLENMIEIFNFDDIKVMAEFLASEESDARKQYILNNNFSIAKV